ncbi:MAG: hypothetical protein ACFE9R_13575 [Candidatus Hermodarchaeota archaeon]
MEQTKELNKNVMNTDKEQTNWADFLDYTRFYEAGEINNHLQELFKKDFENIK